MKKLKKEWEWLKKRSRYPNISWAKLGSQDYNDAIEQINQCYRKMLQIGEVDEALRKANKGVTYMLTCESRREFRRAVKNINERYNRHKRLKKGMLKNFQVHAELIPDPRMYAHFPNKPKPTNLETIVKEQILEFEHYLTTLNVFKCQTCLECHLHEKPKDNDSRYTCEPCRKRGDPNYFIDNNLHPVWYLVDDNGKYVRDANGKKIAQYHIPEELACLSMYEKLLIRRCANFVPTIHLKNGIFGIRGHCVTFPQDISEMCDELPRREDEIVTFVQNIGNKDTTSVFPTSLRVNRHKVLGALRWLKKHNPFYRNIQIREENLNWMGDQDEVNVATDGYELNIKNTPFSKKQDEEEEHVSKSHSVENGNVIEMRTVHANQKNSVPSGRQAQPIQELMDVARKTNQTSKIMNFPPIDHDSPIS